MSREQRIKNIIKTNNTQVRLILFNNKPTNKNK